MFILGNLGPWGRASCFGPGSCRDAMRNCGPWEGTTCFDHGSCRDLLHRQYELISVDRMLYLTIKYSSQYFSLDISFSTYAVFAAKVSIFSNLCELFTSETLKDRPTYKYKLIWVYFSTYKLLFQNSSNNIRYSILRI